MLFRQELHLNDARTTDTGDITHNPQHMIQEHMTIGNIPATRWGEERNDLFIPFYGNHSPKGDIVIQIRANEAIYRGYQVLCFDLPEYGQSKYENNSCKVQNCVQNLPRLRRCKDQGDEIQSPCVQYGDILQFASIPGRSWYQDTGIPWCVSKHRILIDEHESKER